MSSACLAVQPSRLVATSRASPLAVDRRCCPQAHVRPSLWRPWLVTPHDPSDQRSKQTCPYPRPCRPSSSLPADGKTQTFQHPVRLFWPRAKSFDFLYSDGELLLRNLPVQATISLYDQSDSEEEEEEEEEECLKVPPPHFTSYN